MINPKSFVDCLIDNNFDFFVGVPDSLLKNFCLYINELPKEQSIITANEGNAVAIAAGYNITTSKYGVCYMQNSGLGNIVNPLLSLVDEEVYNIPMLFIIGYRGEPGIKDEPQHIKQGKLTLPLLDTLGIKYFILDDNYEKQIKECLDYIKMTNKQVALIVKKDTFDKYESIFESNDLELTREEALNTIISNLNDDEFIVSTTGKTSREIFEIREKYNQGHANDFLTVGSMGHTSSLALGISLNTNKNVYCIDGDGSLIMHMGALAVAIQNANSNFKYILINNGCHESVGGEPTISNSINLKNVLLSFGFNKVYEVSIKEDIIKSLNDLKKENKSALIINTNNKSRKDLGRPTTTPIDNKIEFQNKIRSNNESNNI
jgi:phosphonopyruvate decarboxylase